MIKISKDADKDANPFDKDEVELEHFFAEWEALCEIYGVTGGACGCCRGMNISLGKAYRDNVSIDKVSA